MMLRSPYPWFGGKSKAAPLIWERLGDAPMHVHADEQIVADYLAVLSRYEAEADRIRTGAEAMLRRIDSKLRSLEFLRGAEVRAAVSRLIDGKRVKSVQTVYGTAGYRRKPETVAVVNEDAVLAAIAEGRLPSDLAKTRTIVALDRTALTKHVQATGEVVDGVEVRPAAETFYTKIKD